MAVNIPVSIKKIQDDLPKIKAEMSSLDAQQRKAIKDHLSQLSFQRRLENEINREIKEQIAQRRRLVSLSNRLDRDLKQQKGGGLFGGLQGGVAGGILQAAGIALGTREVIEFAKEAEQMGRQLEGLQTRLRNTVGGQQAYNEAIARGREVTRGMTSEADLASGIFTFLNSKLAENTEEAVQLSRAQNILVGTFQNLGATEERFIRLLAGGNIALFDNFNLNLKVINARQQQIEATRGLSGQEARLAAIKELVKEKADELEGSLTDAEVASRQFEAASADLTAVLGQTLTPAFTGSKTALAEFFDVLVPNLEKFNDWTQSHRDLIEAQRRFNIQTNQQKEEIGLLETALLGFRQGMDDASGGMISYIMGSKNASSENEAFLKILNQVIAEREKDAAIVQKEGTAIEDNTEALEKEAKRLEKLANIREDSVRKLIDIDNEFTEQSKETWVEWREDQAKIFEDWQDKRNDIISKANKDAAKMQSDFAKDMRRLDRDLATDLRRSEQDQKIDEKRFIEDQQKEKKQGRKKKHLEEIQDQRLFEFELRQLAAQGDAAAIQQALERRAIEEQIANEKAQLEQQNEDDASSTKLDRIREDAELERQRKKEDAAIRRSDLQEEFAEEQALKEAALLEAIEQERQNFVERSEELAAHRRDKLDQLEQDRIDSIQEIGKGLAEIKDITQQELRKLIPIFSEFGVDAGVALMDGINESLDINAVIADALNQEVGSQRRTQSSRSRTPAFGSSPDAFQEGGIVPGPLGAPRLAIVHGGEEVLTPQQRQAGSGSGSVTFVVNNPVFGSAMTYPEVEAMFQQFTDEHLAEILN